MSVTYFEHYPHYMGTMNVTIKFTNKQFNKVIELAKTVIKARNKPLGADDVAYDALSAYLGKICKEQDVEEYALIESLIDSTEHSPRRPSSIVNKLKKKGVWSGEWEEGSYAFSNKGAKAARKAVGKIEAKHTEDEFY